MAKNINIGIAGTQFMGKTHSNRYLRLPYFFESEAMR